MTAEILPAIEIETAPEPDAAVIWMHGLGDDGRGWSEVVPTLGLPRGLAIRFIFPHAPIIPVTINNGMRMRAWYDIRQANLAERADVEGVRRSGTQVDALLERETGRGIAPRRALLAGFSQGGAIALYAGLRYPQRLAGIVALSTYLIAPERLDAEASAANRATPIFMAHGMLDPTIPHALGEMSRDYLAHRGYAVDWNAYPMAHQVCAEEIADLQRWIGARLATP